MRKRKPLTASYVVCSVKWCVALCGPEQTLCAVHRQSRDVHPAPLADGEAFAYVPFVGSKAVNPRDTNVCRDCDGTGKCYSCDGEGTHQCEHAGCQDEHDCGNCRGSGNCPDCRGHVATTDITLPPANSWREPKPQRLLAEGWDGDRLWARNYLRALYLPVWIDPTQGQGGRS